MIYRSVVEIIHDLGRIDPYHLGKDIHEIHLAPLDLGLAAGREGQHTGVSADLKHSQGLYV